MIKRAVTTQKDDWDRATIQRADVEYALEVFEESTHDFSAVEVEEQRETLLEAIRVAKAEEERARQAWYAAAERAEREIAG
jgi:hypothetical protein